MGAIYSVSLLLRLQERFNSISDSTLISSWWITSPEEDELIHQLYAAIIKYYELRDLASKYSSLTHFRQIHLLQEVEGIMLFEF